MHQRRLFISSAFAAVLGLSATVASAQPRGDERHRDDGRGPGNGRGNGHGNDRGNGRGPDPRHDPRHGNGPGRGPDRRDLHGRGPHGPRHDDRRHPGRGVGPDHRWHRGDRVPNGYRGRQYVVDNWRRYHLSAPPRGHHWVQLGADFVLIAVATGVIAQIILAN